MFDKGLCKKETNCTFAHGDKELRGLPNFKKTRLCIPFKNGTCPKASSDCKYAHGEGEIRKLAYDYFPQKRELNDNKDRHAEKDRRRGEFRDREYRGQRDNHREIKDHREYRDYRG